MISRLVTVYTSFTHFLTSWIVRRLGYGELRGDPTRVCSESIHHPVYVPGSSFAPSYMTNIPVPRYSRSNCGYFMALAFAFD